MKKSIALIFTLGTICLMLGACGLAAKINARNDMTTSKEQYKNCLIKHSSNPSACEGLKLAYNADMNAFRATSAGIRPGFSNSLDISTTTD